MNRLLCLLAFVPLLGIDAQEVERPVPFDTGGRVMTITPPFAARFRLGPPVWPVTGDFVDARLFSRSSGDFVLVVQRAGGVTERTVLSKETRDQLARAVSEAVSQTGTVTTGSERANVISEPAGGAFTRNQTVASAVIWGPALASFSDDGAVGSAIWLATVGTTFFVTSGMAKKGTITSAQNHMASHGAFRGALMGWATAYVVSGEDLSDDAVAGGILVGSLLSTGVGYARGRYLTDGEAHGATWGSTLTTVLTAGAIGVADGWKASENRLQVATVVAGSLAGYPLGLRWVRRSSYGVTAGDTRAVSTSAVVGAIAAGTLLGDDPDEQLAWGVLTGGYLAGSIVGARALARPYDLSESQGLQLSLGALAGGLIAIAIPTASEAEDGRVYAGLGAAGAIAGMAITKSILSPDRAGRERLGSLRTPSRGNTERALVRVMPANLLLALRPQRNPRPVPLLTLSF
jgi:hypothetical protein